MDSFYTDLAGFVDTAQMLESHHYLPIPEDWFISIVDVRGSTQAISAGRYRDVNFVGAAAITSHLNLLGRDLPFIFGGDGATILINKNMYATAQKILQSLSFHAENTFDLRLHTGIVPVAAIRKYGCDVKVAKYLSGGCLPQAMFKGGGVSLAESLVKSSAQYQLLPQRFYSKEDLFSGLSCRWKPIPSKAGVTLSILVQPMMLEDEQLLKLAISEFEKILSQPLATLNPINMKHARYDSFFKNLKHQLRVTDTTLNKLFFAAVYEMLIAVPFFRFGLYKYFDRLKNYIDKVPAHCDFHKYDDTLKMVINCSSTEYQTLQTYLESQYAQKKLVFGISASDAAQMTCHVQGLADGKHLHFVDGSNGGYAMASVDFKKRLLNTQR